MGSTRLWKQPPARIATDRLLLRRWTLADAARLREAIDVSLADLRPWVPWAAREPTTMAELLERLKKFEADFAAGPEWGYGIFTRDETQLLGGIGLFARIGPTALEVGYWVRTGSMGQGHASEATAAITRVALEMGARHVEIHCDPANPASARVAAKCGYHHSETRVRDYVLPGRRPSDTMVWVYPPDAVPWRPSGAAPAEGLN